MKRILLLILAVCVLALAGCRSEEEIAKVNKQQNEKHEIVIQQAKEEQHLITVKGCGKVTTQAGKAVFALSIITRGEDAQAAEAKNAEVMITLSGVLAENGVFADACRVEKVYTRPLSAAEDQNAQKDSMGYESIGGIQVDYYQIENMNQFISSLNIENVQIEKLSLYLEDPAGAYQTALTAAVQDAGEKAQTIADAAQIEIERISGVTEYTDMQECAAGFDVDMENDFYALALDNYMITVSAEVEAAYQTK